MGALSGWHWLIFLSMIVLPLVVGILSRTFLRALGWPLAIALGVIVAAVIIDTLSASPVIEPVGFAKGAASVTLMLVVLSAIFYGLKILVRRAHARSIDQLRQ